jgi:hypothetical protein
VNVSEHKKKSPEMIEGNNGAQQNEHNPEIVIAASRLLVSVACAADES